MKGDWEVESIDALFRRIIRMDITHSSLVTLNRLYLNMKSRLTNLQTRIGSLAIAETHEDLFVVQDWESYGHYYAPTLAAWQERFEANWPQIAAIQTERRFDEKFRRMFNYYLLSSKAGFETEHLNLWHIVMTKQGKGSRVYPRVNLLSQS